MEELTEIENFLLDGKIPVKKYKSKRTGITIVQADVQGPTVNGYFCLATEAQDDDGLPHTLEHLIFLGSHDYPYKGVLDGLANRCLAMGTNAWTDIDHTCYTISCAGYEGFLNILPVYLDHILWATITDEGFYTEVHHITSKGKDAGVVYCEMEGRENTGPSRIQRKLLQLLYPGDSGYNKETGGICQNLRSLTVDKVRQYHKDFYRTDNLCLIITGKVPVEEIAARLKTVEDNVINRAGQQQPIPRPWHIHDVPVLDKTVEKEEVLFPADDEETGYVVVGWRGPVITELLIGTALEVLWEYLTDSAVSPLQKEFVDIPEPLCSSIHAGHNLLSIRSVYVTLTGVPTPHLEEIPEQLFAKLHHIVGVDGQEREGIDMERMKAVIDHLRQQYKTALEDDPHETIAHSAIHDFLYNPRKNGDELKHVMDEIERLHEMATKGEDFWLDMISKFLLDAPHVNIIGRPSECLGKQMADDEQNRVEKQKQDLGEEKLAELEVKLKDAIEKNEVPVPPEIIQQFVVPDVNKIPLIPVATVRNGEAVGEGATLEASQKLKALLNVESSDLPFCTQFDNIQSEFIEIIAYINTSQMSAEDRVLLEWWLDVVFEGPISRINADGSQELIPHDQVIAELNSTIVSHSSALGFGGDNFVCGAFAQLASISLKCELSKYKETVVRLREFLWQTKFDRERLLISAKKLDIDATSYRRSGGKVAAAVNKEQNFSKESNHYITNFIRQQQFLRKQLQLLANDDGAAQIEAQVEAFRRELLKPERIFVQVLGNLEKVEDPAGPWRWENFLPPQPRPDVFSLFDQESHVSHEAGKVVLSKELQSDRATGGQNHIVGLAAVESCVLLQSCQWNSSFDAVKKTAGMTVLIEYLTTMESIFWKQIRGQGLSYGYSIANNNETGLLLFSLTRSNSVVKAYQEAKRIIEDFHSKKHQFDETFVESAKSSVLFSIISREQTPRTAAMQTYIAFLKGVDNRATLAAIGSIQLPDLTEALEDLARLFDSEATNTTITCNVSAVSDIVHSFESDFGKTFTTVTQLEEFFCPGTVVLMEDDGENEDENMYSDEEE